MERNYKEDQANEIEALEAIYSDEVEILETIPYHKFAIRISTEDFNNDDEEEGLTCKLIFTYTGKYPDEGPQVELDEQNFQDSCIDEQLIAHIKENITENIGMEMIFGLVSSAQEWLNQHHDTMKQRKEEEAERQKNEVEEEERKKFEGTRVTVETFLKWRTEFEIDMGIAAKKEKLALEAKKLTGKELFLIDNSLIESDIKFLLEAGDTIESVKIDESLFENIDDLDLSDSDDDDPDYEPGKDD